MTSAIQTPSTVPSHFTPHAKDETILTQVKDELAQMDGKLQQKLDAGWSLLHIVASFGTVEQAQALLESGVDIDQEFEGKTPLHIAAEKRQEDLALLFVAKGADITKTTNQDWNPLHCAAYYNLPRLATAILKKNPELATAKTAEKNFPLHMAVARGCFEAVEAFITVCPQHISVRDEEGIGWTPLHAAIFHKRPAIAQALAEAVKTDIDIPSADGATPLHIAAETGDINMLSFLIKSGADVSATMQRITGRTKEAIKDLKWTPLHVAARFGHAKCVEALIEAGADPGAQDHIGRTPLHIAAQLKEGKVTETLVTASSSCIDHRDAEGRTSFFLAVANDCSEEIARLFIDAGSDIRAKTAKGETPAGVAVLYQKPSWRALAKTLRALQPDF